MDVAKIYELEESFKDWVAERPESVQKMIESHPPDELYMLNGIIRSDPENAVAACNEGNTAIVVDDGCYAVRNWNGRRWGWSAHIFPEALVELKKLPVNPNNAKCLLDV